MNQMSLADFAGALMRARERMEGAEKAALRFGAEVVADEAKSLIGTQYAGWAALADSTIKQKQARGQTGRVSATDPLFATGELRATIAYQVEGYTAIVGTPDKVGVYQEFGTSRMPPRPFLAPAAHRSAHGVVNAIGDAITKTLAGLPYRAP